MYVSQEHVEGRSLPGKHDVDLGAGCEGGWVLDRLHSGCQNPIRRGRTRCDGGGSQRAAVRRVLAPGEHVGTAGPPQGQRLR